MRIITNPIIQPYLYLLIRLFGKILSRNLAQNWRIFYGSPSPLGRVGVGLFVCCLYYSFKGTAQSPNIVSNPSFEQYQSTPIGWFYKGEHFTEVMKYWSSPTSASPDAFGPKIRVPDAWAEKEFGKQKAHSGTSMVGITVYGCTNGKPHCREYIQIQLNEPLVVGQYYYVEFWANHLPRSLQINKLGTYFSSKRLDTKTEAPLPFCNPQIVASKIIDAGKGWQKISGSFKATFEGEFLLLGNFFDDTQTQTIAPKRTDVLNYAYYYIDDVLVKKIPPIVPIPVKADDLTKAILEVGKTITLKDIYFDNDKAELLPRSFVELRKLVYVLRKKPTLKIEIQGHTDNNGTAEHNLILSQERAQAVLNFLLYNTIDKKRITIKGFGQTKPIATNATDEGRQQNRRVTFLILK